MTMGLRISTISWPQTDMKGTRADLSDDVQVPPGIYTITARLSPTDTNVAIDVTVVPEASSLVLFAAGLPILNHISRRRRR